MGEGAITAIALVLLLTVTLLQLHLHAVSADKSRGLAVRLAKLERFMGEDIEWVAAGPSPGAQKSLVGQQAPALALRSLENTELTIQRLAGQPVLLLFLNSGCTHCRQLFEQILDYLDVAPPPLALPTTIVSICDAALAPDLDEESPSGIRVFQIVLPPNHPIKDQYSVRGTPHAILLNGQGIVLQEGHILTFEQLLQQTQRLVDSETTVG